MSDIHYYSNYAGTHDIDCFFRIGDVAYHFASNGQPIPSFITRQKNIAIQKVVYAGLASAQGIIETRRETIRNLIEKQIGDGIRSDGTLYDSRDSFDVMIDDYASTFEEMARFGFVSMDLDENGVFHVIAKSKEQKIPGKLMEMLPEVKAEQVVIEDERNYR